MRWIEKMNVTFLKVTFLMHHAKFWQDRTTRAGCRCENMVFVCFFTRRIATRFALLRSKFLRSVNNRMQSLREILRMVIIDTVINTILGRLTLDPARMHSPSWDDGLQDDAKRQTACIRFTHRPKIRFFATQGRLVAPI